MYQKFFGKLLDTHTTTELAKKRAQQLHGITDIQLTSLLLKMHKLKRLPFFFILLLVHVRATALGLPPSPSVENMPWGVVRADDVAVFFFYGIDVYGILLRIRFKDVELEVARLMAIFKAIFGNTFAQIFTFMDNKYKLDRANRLPALRKQYYEQCTKKSYGVFFISPSMELLQHTASDTATKWDCSCWNFKKNCPDYALLGEKCMDIPTMILQHYGRVTSLNTTNLYKDLNKFAQLTIDKQRMSSSGLFIPLAEVVRARPCTTKHNCVHYATDRFNHWRTVANHPICLCTPNQSPEGTLTLSLSFFLTSLPHFVYLYLFLASTQTNWKRLVLSCIDSDLLSGNRLLDILTLFT